MLEKPKKGQWVRLNEVGFRIIAAPLKKEIYELALQPVQILQVNKEIVPGIWDIRLYRPFNRIRMLSVGVDEIKPT